MEDGEGGMVDAVQILGCAVGAVVIHHQNPVEGDSLVKGAEETFLQQGQPVVGYDDYSEFHSISS